MIQEKRRSVCDEGLIIMEAEYDKSDKESIVEHAKETKDKKSLSSLMLQLILIQKSRVRWVT